MLPSNATQRNASSRNATQALATQRNASSCTKEKRNVLHSLLQFLLTTVFDHDDSYLTWKREVVDAPLELDGSGEAHGFNAASMEYTNENNRFKLERGYANDAFSVTSSLIKTPRHSPTPSGWQGGLNSLALYNFFFFLFFFSPSLPKNSLVIQTVARFFFEVL